MKKHYGQFFMEGGQKIWQVVQQQPQQTKKVDSLEKAKNAPCIFNNWANFYKGEFISNTI